jgi:hypothetical protein
VTCGGGTGCDGGGGPTTFTFNKSDSSKAGPSLIVCSAYVEYPHQSTTAGFTDNADVHSHVDCDLQMFYLQLDTYLWRSGYIVAQHRDSASFYPSLKGTAAVQCLTAQYQGTAYVLAKPPIGYTPLQREGYATPSAVVGVTCT